MNDTTIIEWIHSILPTASHYLIEDFFATFQRLNAAPTYSNVACTFYLTAICHGERSYLSNLVTQNTSYDNLFFTLLTIVHHLDGATYRPPVDGSICKAYVSSPVSRVIISSNQTEVVEREDGLINKTIHSLSNGLRELAFHRWMSGEGVIPVVAYSVTKQGVSIVMPRGVSINHRSGLGILEDLTKAVARCHTAGLVHADLKLNNTVLIDNRPCLIDFGLSCLIEGKPVVTQPNTYDYRPPEHIKGFRPYSVEVDVWALGLISLSLARRERVSRWLPYTEDANISDYSKAALQQSPEDRPSSEDLLCLL